MPCPDCDGDLTILAVPEPFEPHASKAALTVGLCVDCLRLHSAGAPPNDGVSRPLAGMLPDGDAGATVMLLAGTFDSFVFSRAGIVDCVEFAEQSGTDVYLTFDRLQQTAMTPHFDVTHRQHQLDALL